MSNKIQLSNVINLKALYNKKNITFEIYNNLDVWETFNKKDALLLCWFIIKQIILKKLVKSK